MTKKTKEAKKKKKSGKEGLYLHTIKLYMSRTKFALYSIVKSEIFFFILVRSATRQGITLLSLI